MRSLGVGDRVRLNGGYEFEPRWLGGADVVEGTVAAFIPGQNAEPAAVIKLDRTIAVETLEGNFVVLELRYVGATWGPTETVHIELCDFMPGPRAWANRRQGKWVESHATYRLMDS